MLRASTVSSDISPLKSIKDLATLTLRNVPVWEVVVLSAAAEKAVIMGERLNSILSSYEAKRDELIPILQQVQEEFGYLSEQAMFKVAQFTGEDGKPAINENSVDQDSNNTDRGDNS